MRSGLFILDLAETGSEIPKEVIIDPFDEVKSVHSGRRGA